MNALKGLRILNTRPGAQGKILSEAITKAGGISLNCPLLSIEPLSDWMNALPNLSIVDKAIFISVNAVENCFSILKDWPESIEVFAIGQATAKALTQTGIRSVLLPEKADSEHLLVLPELQEVRGKTILLFKGKGGRPLIENSLVERQARLVILEVYNRTVIKQNSRFIDAIWQNDRVDIILITSEEILNNLFTLFPESWLCKKPCLLVSERLVNKAKNKGVQTIITGTPETIMETLITFSRTRL